MNYYENGDGFRLSNRVGDWRPEDTIGQILSDVMGMPNEKISTYLDLYSLFRQAIRQVAPVPPANDYPFVEWLEKLFGENGDLQYRNLDSVGEDYLSWIVCCQRLREIKQGHEWREVVPSFLSVWPDGWLSRDFSLNNTALRFEAVIRVMKEDDDLDLYIPNEKRNPAESFVLFTDAPQRLTTTEEMGDPVEYLINTARFSRYIRALSVQVQEGEGYKSIQRVGPYLFELPPALHPMNDRRLTYTTNLFAENIVFSREFRLWDRNRTFGFPDIRTISERTGIPYRVLLSIEGREQSTPKQRFDGLSFIKTDIPERLCSLIRYYFEKHIIPF